MPQPIDMQTELGRTTLAERIQDAAGRVALAAQYRAVHDADEARIRTETQIHEPVETQGDRIREDERRRNPFVRRRRRPGQGVSEAAPSVHPSAAKAPDDEAHRFDITV